MKLKASWRNQLWPLRVMRLWLGATWIYAGWDKASDPGFLTSGSPTFIGSQLAAYAQNSPIDFLLNKILDHATQVGILVMVAEFAIGFATLLWIAPTWAAFGGFLTSLFLWLSSTWNVQPYFLASNSVYTVFWFTYFLFLYGSRRKSNISIDRRGFIRVSLIAALAVASAGLGRLLPKKSAAVSAGPAKIIEDRALAVGKIHNFTSKSGSPAVLFKSKTGVYAYSAVCTHEGCTVQYNSATKNLQCGCHGAVFDPGKDGTVVTGPTNKPLPKIKVAVEGAWIVEA
ncbi:MAG: Rieske 2Fe-2S domain-containing protein [Actinobacteria bacterium]|nr:Rieske 2Fe-2S domain-containing protein [Actinomycetota bacterium]